MKDSEIATELRRLATPIGEKPGLLGLADQLNRLATRLDTRPQSPAASLPLNTGEALTPAQESRIREIVRAEIAHRESALAAFVAERDALAAADIAVSAADNFRDGGRGYRAPPGGGGLVAIP